MPPYKLAAIVCGRRKRRRYTKMPQHTPAEKKKKKTSLINEKTSLVNKKEIADAFSRVFPGIFGKDLVNKVTGDIQKTKKKK